MQLESQPAEHLAIDSIASRLTPQENGFRRQLIDYAIVHKKPFNIHAPETGQLQENNTGKMIENLIAKKAVTASDNGDVNFVYPVSVMPTSHQVRLQDGRKLFAMCAVDALGTTFTFGQDVYVHSKCAECDKPVSVEIQSKAITKLEPEKTRVLHVNLNKFDNWACSA